MEYTPFIPQEQDTTSCAFPAQYSPGSKYDVPQHIVVPPQSPDAPGFSYPTKLRGPDTAPILGRQVEGCRFIVFDNKLELRPNTIVRGKGDSSRQKMSDDLKQTMADIANRKETCFGSWRKLRRLVEKRENLRAWLEGSNRKKCYGWSHKSRVALIRRLGECSVSSFETPYFISLTYHLKYPDAAGAKRDLKNWLDRIRRQDKDFAYVWKLEFQERGAPHFHCIIFPSDNRMTGNQLRQHWHEIARDNEDDKHHAEYGTMVDRCERLHSFQKMFRYVSKYASKQVQNDEPNGRYWGTSRNIVDPEKTDSLPITPEVETVIRRVAKRWLQGTSPYHGDQRILTRENVESRKSGDLYFDVPTLRGYQKPDGNWCDCSGYGGAIAERWRRWPVHLLFSRDVAFRLLDWAMSEVYGVNRGEQKRTLPGQQQNNVVEPGKEQSYWHDLVKRCEAEAKRG